MSSVLSATPAAASTPTERLIQEELHLYERIVRRDTTALLECLDRLGPLVYCSALAHTGRQARAEELTEAMFLSFWRDPEAFPPAHGPLGLQLLRRMAEDLGNVPTA